MVSPYKIDGAALISFSGGRTSAFMLKHILDAHGGTLPDDVKVTFANTGKEMPETLDFVRDCGERWGVEIVWLEYRRAESGPTFAVVNHSTASRNGEPFRALIDSRGFLPNPVSRFCTSELKIRTMNRWAASIGMPRFDKVLGLRADESHRVFRLRSGSERGEGDIVTPLFTQGVTKRDVSDWWARQNWGLTLPSVNGTTPLGNCDLCFLKGAATIQGIMRDRPELAQWWIKAEAEARASKPMGAFFRKDRPSYAAMLDAVQRQSNFDFGEADAMADCFCGDAS